MINVGVDLHKRSGFAVIKDEDGSVLGSFSFKNNWRGISEFVQKLRGFKDVKVAVESSGNYWVRLYEELEENGIRVVLTNPMKTRAIAEAKIKTDKLDALAEEASRAIAREAVKDSRVELLLGFKGIDYYTAMIIVNEIGDINRFSSPRKLVSWAGLCPSVRQSGGRCRMGGITKQGNKWVRWALVQAAHQAARHDGRLKAFFERVAARRGVQKAIVAVARKMLVSIYYVLKRREPYRGEDAGLRRRKLIRLRRLAC